MRLWTVQGEKHWRQSHARGWLTGGDGQHIEHDWRPAYEWMRREMSERVGGFSGDYPVWAWLESPAGRLRHSGGWGHVGDRMVLLVVEVPEHRVLRSSYQAWHAVMNDTPVDVDDSGDPVPGIDKRDSWRRIFNPLDAATRSWGSPPCVQACVDGVDLRTELVAVLPFKILST